MLLADVLEVDLHRVADVDGAQGAAQPLGQEHGVDLVRSVVPKQGMVTAMMSLAGRSRASAWATAGNKHRQGGVPGRRTDPTTAVLAWVCSRRFFRPRAAM